MPEDLLRFYCGGHCWEHGDLWPQSLLPIVLKRVENESLPDQSIPHLPAGTSGIPPPLEDILLPPLLVKTEPLNLADRNFRGTFHLIFTEGYHALSPSSTNSSYKALWQISCIRAVRQHLKPFHILGANVVARGSNLFLVSLAARLITVGSAAPSH